MLCPECQGKKFVELNHGLLARRCPRCRGTGEVEAQSSEATPAKVNDKKGPKHRSTVGTGGKRRGR